MKFNPDAHHRKSIRLPEYDYSQEGYYFITICIHERMPLFGNVIDGVMILNDAGKMIEKWWKELPNKFTDIRLDAYVVMPNHMHGVIEIIETNKTRATTMAAPTDQIESNNVGVPLVGTLKNPWNYFHVGEIIGAFKSLTTVEYIHGVNSYGWPAFNKRLWQRNYYERIIRNESELANIQEYIQNNPAQWTLDDLYVT